jgi:hypothetical protein
MSSYVKYGRYLIIVFHKDIIKCNEISKKMQINKLNYIKKF